VRDIVADLQKPEPMNRLLQGDVGSGKTLVAMLARWSRSRAGLQVAIMAPTEILAEQHARTLSRFFATTRYAVALLTGRTGGAERRERLANIANGTIHVVVGTHALVQETVQFARLGLAIVDEQHRFGVVQRADLRKKGAMPDVLVMTGDADPRTLALTTYGELDVTVMRDRPPGRSPIATTVRPESRRDDVWTFVRGELSAGRQAYVIYPLVEESEKIDVRDATAMADSPVADGVPRVAGRPAARPARADAKQRVMDAFSLRRAAAAGRDDGGRGRLRRAERDGDRRRARRALRAVAAAPAARTGRAAGPIPGHCVPALSVAAHRRRAGPASRRSPRAVTASRLPSGPDSPARSRRRVRDADRRGCPRCGSATLVRDAAIPRAGRGEEAAALALHETLADDPAVAAIRDAWPTGSAPVHVG
jgi:hypothetical protein